MTQAEAYNSRDVDGRDSFVFFVTPAASDPLHVWFYMLQGSAIEHLGCRIGKTTQQRPTSDGVIIKVFEVLININLRVVRPPPPLFAPPWVSLILVSTSSAAISELESSSTDGLRVLVPRGTATAVAPSNPAKGRASASATTGKRRRKFRAKDKARPPRLSLSTPRIIAGAFLSRCRRLRLAVVGDEEVFYVVVGRGRVGDAGETEEARRGRLESDDGCFLERELPLPVTELVAGRGALAGPGSEALEVAGEEAELDEDAAPERAAFAHLQNGQVQYSLHARRPAADDGVAFFFAAMICLLRERKGGKKGDDGKQKYFCFGYAKSGKTVSQAKNALYPRPSIKTNCKAKINVVIRNDDNFVINNVSLEHNHVLSPGKS
ncbi:hypothetical protein ZIOFF_053959 [Zingiber officinale]|uniref:FAR1 domain-containing protein n=1 Tax=Zingiber officinale TaxID=94328 RepID=A0A8J5KM71_ZINOF|nr:hypothetical protein ZIOFF_053959 [Zingiber officinale]